MALLYLNPDHIYYSLISIFAEQSTCIKLLRQLLFNYWVEKI